MQEPTHRSEFLGANGRPFPGPKHAARVRLRSTGLQNTGRVCALLPDDRERETANEKGLMRRSA